MTGWEVPVERPKWWDRLHRHPLRTAGAVILALLSVSSGLASLLGFKVPPLVVAGAFGAVLALVLLAATLLRLVRAADRHRPSGVAPKAPTASHEEDEEEHSSLPAPRERMLGREEHLRDVLRRLDSHRLVTLVGAGGSGKTLLALEAARRVAGTGGLRAHFVDLQPLKQLEQVSNEVGRALGLREAPDVRTLVRGARSKKGLLVLDNCEHVLDAAGEVVGRLLNDCPDIRVLVTSRQPLDHRDESVVVVKPLPVPQGNPSATQAMQYPAVRLFIEQARRRRDDFHLTQENVGSVLQICQRVDGLPLALIVAAAQTGHRGVSEIVHALDECLEWRGPHDSRHLVARRTLRSTIDSSVQLLTERQARVLARLSVFAAPFTCEDAELVDLEGEGHVADDVNALVTASLVVHVGDRGDKPVFRLLEVIRQYAEDALKAAGETDRVRLSHLIHFVRVTDGAASGLTSRRRLEWLRLLHANHANLRSALEWGGTKQHEPGLAQRLAGNLSWFWNFSGRLQEGQVWLEAAVEWQGTYTLGFARATYGAGVLAFLRGDVGAARRRLEQSLVASESLTLAGGEDARAAQALKGYALCVLAMNHTNAGELEVAVRTAGQSVAAFEACGDAWGAALGHNDLGTVLLRAGDRSRASAALEASLEAWNEIGDSWGLALVLTNIATLHYSLLDRDDPTSDPARARRYMERALHLQLRDGDLWGAAVSHLVLGDIARAEGDLARATARYLDSLERNEQVDRPGIVAILLDRLAAVAAGNGDGHRAALLFGAATGYRQRRGIPLVRRQELLRNSDVELARGLMPAKEWQQALARGERMTLEEATRAADPAVPVSTGGVAAAS